MPLIGPFGSFRQNSAVEVQPTSTGSRIDANARPGLLGPFTPSELSRITPAFEPWADASSAYNDLILTTPGLLSYWPGDEASGTIAYDQKSGLNGVYSGTPTLGQASLLTCDTDTGVAYQRADLADFVELNSNVTAFPAGASSSTIEAWIKPTVTNVLNNDIFGYGASNGARRIMRIDTSARLVFSDGTNERVLSASSALAAGSIYYLVITYDGSTLQGYINGVAALSVGSITLATTSTVAASIGVLSNWFDGIIQKVGLYTTALSAATVAQHWVVGACIYAKTKVVPQAVNRSAVW